MEQRKLPRAAVLAADTTVALDGRILGKPADRREAAAMLAALSGRRHEVLTAVALQVRARAGVRGHRSRRSSSGRCRARRSAQYVATGESDDKAGAYAIQGRAAPFVAELAAAISGVMGLPLYETAQLLERMGAQRERRAAR